MAAALAWRLSPSRIVTSIYKPDRTYELPPDIPVVYDSALSRIPAFTSDARRALPLLPLSWMLKVIPAGSSCVVSSSGWAHLIRKETGALKVVYCHNPPRWLYQPDDYSHDLSFGKVAILKALTPFLKKIDRQGAKSADLYIANSNSVRERVWQAYGIQAHVIHPPVTFDFRGEQEAVDVPESGFFLSVGRPRGYKNLARLREAFAVMPEQNLVIVGADAEHSDANIMCVGRVSEAQLRYLYARATAVISVSSEDFGLTPLEGNLFGTPALVLAEGGFLDSVKPGLNGEFISQDTVPAIVESVRAFPSDWDAVAVKEHAAHFGLDSFLRQLDGLLRNYNLISKDLAT